MTSRWVRLLANAALAVSVITLLSRFVGFARWLVFSPTVGAGAVGTAYQTANQVPNILYEVIAGGALAGAVVPLLAAPLARADPRAVSRIASALLTWAITLTLPLAVLVAVFHRQLAGVFVEAESDTGRFAGHFLLMFAPQLVLYAIGAVLTGVLQAHRRFLWPAFMPLLSSLVVIATYLAYGAVAGGPETAEPSALALLGWGTTAGVAMLALPLALPTARTGVRLRPSWRFPAGVASRAARLATAGMTALLAQQVSVLITLVVSNTVGGTGVFVVFSYIQAVYLLPYAVLAVPIATVVFPTLSRQVAEASAEVAATVATTTGMIIRVGFAGSVVLVAAAAPLAAFFSSFDAAARNPDVPFGTMAAGITLIALAVPGWCMVAWASRVFYSLEHSRYAAIGTTTGWLLVAGTVALGGLVLPGLVAGGITLPGLAGSRAAAGPAGAGGALSVSEATLLLVCAGHALGMIVAGVLLVVLLRRAAGPEAVRGTVGGTLRTLVLAVAAAVGAAWTSHLLLAAFAGLPPTVGAVLAGVLAALAGLAVMGAGLLAVDRGLLRAGLRLAAGRGEDRPGGAAGSARPHPSDADRPGSDPAGSDSAPRIA
ncbi:murein biosynthesis integral membrane protein MurJ [Brevibacterium pityocampae]|uniref:Peptidoglycan lipid II flippase n=1 Tax=Brevibacterium pityocampae TaxID=506594 RepID=A0ABP8JR21_9MICO